MQVRAESTFLSATRQSTQDAEQRFDESIATDPRMAALFIRGMNDGINSLDGADQIQFWLIQKPLMDLYQTHHYHHENGIIDEEFWQNWVAQMDDGMKDFPNWGRDMVHSNKISWPWSAW
jgi:hypothetical protein